MPNWKKIALSGSNPEFSSLTVDGAIEASKFSGSFSGSYQGDGSALTGLSLPQVTTVTDTFTSTTSKSITHNFGTKNVIVQVYDTNDAFMIPSSIVTTDTNSVDISFANNASGRVVVAKGGHLVSGSVDFDNLANAPTLLSSSAQITGFGFISQSSDGAISSSAQIVALGANIVSSSAQIATDISGSFVATSASFATTIGSLTSDYTELTNVPANIVSSSTQFQTLSLTNTSTDDTVLLTTTEDSSTAGPVLTLKRNSSSPADADYLGQLKFKGENDADQEVIYAKITAKVQDASDGSEDGLIEFANKKAGSNNITARLRSDKLQLLNGTELEVDGQVSASSYVGDGSGLTGIITGSVNYLPIYDSNGTDFDNSIVSQSAYGEGDTQLVIGGSRTVINQQVITTTYSSPSATPLRLGGIGNTEEIRINGADIESATDAAKKILAVGQDGQIHTADGNESISGSFSGSFQGDGSNLTGVGTPGAISASAQIAGLGAGILSGSQTLFSQSFSSATAVTASHGFGTKEVVVSVYDNNDNLFFPNNIKTATTSAVHLDFNTARTGRVVVSKGGHVVDLLPTASFVLGSNVDGAVPSSSFASTAGSSTSSSFATSASFASTGPFLSNTGGTVDGDIILTGTLTAQEIIVSSSVYNVTQSFSSGSTIFGNSLDDTHLFTGSLNVTGSANLVASQSLNNRDNSGLSFWAGSQAQYDALGSYDSNKIYFVT